MSNPNQHIELIYACLSGEATREQKAELDQLMISDPAIKNDYDSAKKIFQFNALKKEWDQESDADRYKKDFLKIRNEAKSNPPFAKPSTYVKTSVDKSKDKKIIPIAAEKKSDKLILRIAAVLLAGLGLAYFLFQDNSDQKVVVAHADPIEQSNDIVINTNTTEKNSVLLHDSSNVILNNKSKLTYPPSFSSDERIVEFEGEGFFLVQPDVKPFIIHVGNARIAVKGTSFNVNANNPDSIVVTVKEGSVEFYHKDDTNKVLLTADEKGTLQTGNYTAVQAANDNQNYLSWHNGILTFVDKPLKKIINQLNLHYQINLVFEDPQLGNCQITARYDNLSIEEIFELFEITLGLKVKEEKNKLIISGEGC